MLNPFNVTLIDSIRLIDIFMLHLQGMRHWLAYLFIIIFSFQVLPVKELGELLVKGTMTEEIHEAGVAEDGGKLKGKSEAFKLVFVNNFGERNRFLSHEVHTAIHKSERLPHTFIPDIITPPPNSSC
jgi:hypothetical protein